VPRPTSEQAAPPIPVQPHRLAQLSSAIALARGWVAGIASLTLAAIATILISVAVAPDLNGLLGAALGLLMLAIALVDARRFIIPNELTIAALVLAVLHALSNEPQPIWGALIFAALRGLALGLIFFAVRETYRWWRGRDGLGLGDVKLAAVAGVWLQWPTIPIAIEIAALAALAFCGGQYLVGGRTVRATSRIPFGLFLAPAIWLAWLIEALLDRF